METITLAVDWGTPLMSMIKSGMQLAAVLIVIAAVFGAVKHAMGGKIGAAFKVVIVAAIIATLLWRPELVESLINAFSGLTDGGVQQVGELTNQDSLSGVVTESGS